MLDQLQKEYIAEKTLKDLYKKGTIPNYIDFISMLNKLYRYKTFGKPFFNPIGAAKGLVVNPAFIESNAVSIKQDIELLFQDILDLKSQEVIISSGTYGQYKQLKQKVDQLIQELDIYLQKFDPQITGTFFDNFTNTNNIDLQDTTAFVDTINSYVSLPISINSSIKYNTNNIKIISEQYSSNYKTVGGPFLSVFNDYTDQIWQASFNKDDHYQIVINLTGKDIVPTHINEVQINRIVINSIGQFNISIEGSTDQLNWFSISNKQISTTTTFSFNSSWVLFLRFTITNASQLIGIRHIDISQVGTSNYGLLYSKLYTSDSPIYSFNFSNKQDVPYGTIINHYIQAGVGNDWVSIQPGKVNVGTSINKTIVFSDTLSADNPSDSISLYYYPINLSQPPIINSGELKRGINQFNVESIHYDFASKADPNHIPDINDWKLGFTHNNYMSSLGSNSGDYPPLPASGTASFIMNYSNSQQDWWGIYLRDKSRGSNLVSNYSYKLTTYIYSDRNVTINNFGGGVYVRDPTNPVATISPTKTLAYGWSFYINGNRVAKDNKFYVTAVPGSGSLTSAQGISFPVALELGWNKIEVLVYIPPDSYLDDGLQTGFNIFLLFRPNLFSFSIPTQGQFSFAPNIIEYPIWADGINLSRVTEFYLKWNVTKNNHDYWAWRIDPSSGVATQALLNYNPMITSNQTIDGKFTGNNPQFNLSYIYISQPINSILYKAELKKDQNATQPPKLYSYSFSLIR